MYFLVRAPSGPNNILSCTCYSTLLSLFLPSFHIVVPIKYFKRPYETVLVRIQNKLINSMDNSVCRDHFDYGKTHREQ